LCGGAIDLVDLEAEARQPEMLCLSSVFWRPSQIRAAW
jgi:hypothetical protein